MAFISSLPLISSFQSRSNNTLLANNRCSPCIPSQNPHHQQQHQTPSRLHPWRMCDASTSKKDRFNITLLPGDGIGPEIMDATVCVLEAISKKYSIEFNFETALIGGAAIDEYKYPFPEATLKQCQASDSILLACIGGPKWDDYPRELRPETGLLTLRRDLDLFANLRPAKVIPQLIDSSTLKKEVIDGVDIMVIRELTSDVYFGTPKGLQVRDDGSGKRVGYNNMIYQEEEIERIGHVAYKIASKRNGTLFSIDKANVLDVSQLWRNVMTELNDQYKHISLSHMYVDNAAMQLIRYPKQFDTIVTGNIFGDILSDAASMLVGSLGMLPSASLGGSSNSPGVFEPVHGSAPDIAGENKANPAACILSAAMMMKYDLNRPDISLALEQAVNDVLDDGLRTGDIMSEGMTLVGCKEFGEAVVQKVLVAAEAPAAAV